MTTIIASPRGNTKIPSSVPYGSRIDWLTSKVDKFCVLPWLNLNTNTDGKIKLCCNIHLDQFVKNKEGVPFNLGHHNIEDIWNGYHMNFVRENTRLNYGVMECDGCYKNEKLSGHSPRMGQNKVWIDNKKEDPVLDRFFEDVVTKPAKKQIMVRSPWQPKPSADHWSIDQLPTSLELRLGNQCNLQCVTCWSVSSSMIHAERAEYLDKNLVEGEFAWFKELWQKERSAVDRTDVHNWFETETFYNNFKKMAPKLRRLYTTGGEPTLIKANYKMFQLLLDAENTSCRVEFTSNMTTWNPSFYDKLEKFDNVEIQMSVDGVGDIGEYVRFPSNFETVKNNIKKAVSVAATRPGWTIKCYTVLQALNFNQMPLIWEMLNEIAVKYNKKIYWWPITLTSPSHLGLACIKKETRQAFVPELVEAAKKYWDSRAPFFVSPDFDLEACKGPIENEEYDQELAERLMTYVKFMDLRRPVKIKGMELFKDIL